MPKNNKKVVGKLHNHRKSMVLSFEKNSDFDMISSLSSKFQSLCYAFFCT